MSSANRFESEKVLRNYGSFIEYGVTLIIPP